MKAQSNTTTTLHLKEYERGSRQGHEVGGWEAEGLNSFGAAARYFKVAVILSFACFALPSTRFISHLFDLFLPVIGEPGCFRG